MKNLLLLIAVGAFASFTWTAQAMAYAHACFTQTEYSVACRAHKPGGKPWDEYEVVALIQATKQGSSPVRCDKIGRSAFVSFNDWGPIGAVHTATNDASLIGGVDRGQLTTLLMSDDGTRQAQISFLYQNGHAEVTVQRTDNSAGMSAELECSVLPTAKTYPEL